MRFHFSFSCILEDGLSSQLLYKCLCSLFLPGGQTTPLWYFPANVMLCECLPLCLIAFFDTPFTVCNTIVCKVTRNIKLNVSMFFLRSASLSWISFLSLGRAMFVSTLIMSAYLSRFFQTASRCCQQYWFSLFWIGSSRAQCGQGGTGYLQYYQPAHQSLLLSTIHLV